MTNIYAFPDLSLRWTPVWQRNLLVWRKLAIASVLGNIADPLLYMLALGYGIGTFVPEVNGMPYIAFLGTGMVCQSAMFTASFEGKAFFHTGSGNAIKVSLTTTNTY